MRPILLSVTEVILTQIENFLFLRWALDKHYAKLEALVSLMNRFSLYIFFGDLEVNMAISMIYAHLS